MERKLKILIASNTSSRSYGGVERHKVHLAEALRKRGCSVDLIFAEDIPHYFPFNRLNFNIMIVREISRRERNGIRYDVVNIHGGDGAFFGIYNKFRKLLGKKQIFIVTTHGLEERTYTEAIKEEENVSFKRWLKLKARILFNNIAMKLADGIVVVARCDRKILLKKNYPESKVFFIPNGVTEDFFEPLPDVTRIKNSILFVGGWIYRKGIKYLVPALVETLHEVKDAKVSLIGVGVEEHTVRNMFPQELYHRIRIVRSFSREEARKEYQSHSIFVLPSVAEGMPISLLEAMASGCACVATEVGGIKDVIDNGKDGLLCPPRDVNALKDALITLLKNEKLRHQLAVNAFKKAQAFKWDFSAEQFLHCIQSLYKR